jgi:cytochrome c
MSAAASRKLTRDRRPAARMPGGLVRGPAAIAAWACMALGLVACAKGTRNDASSEARRASPAIESASDSAGGGNALRPAEAKPSGDHGLAPAADERAVDAAAATALGPDSLPTRFGFGRSADPARIAALDIDVRPDGQGLPPGSGTVRRGAAIFAAKCASCHGLTGTEGPDDVLVGREPREGFLFGQYTSLTRTIGNYWPYATTLYDYIHRAMPLDAPGSLTPDEVYSLAAWLLYRNELLPEDAVLDAATLPGVRMPARDRFVADDRTGGAIVR